MISNEIESLALAISKLEDDKEGLTCQLKQVNEDLNNHEKELADLLTAEGFAIGSKIKLQNGRTLQIKDFFSASIPSQSSINSAKDQEKMQDMIDKKDSCLKWLDDNNLGGVIKNEVVVSFDRGDNEKAKELMLELQEKQLDCLKEESVHPMTLKATLKEALSQGLNVPFDLFSVQTGIQISIK